MAEVPRLHGGGGSDGAARALADPAVAVRDSGDLSALAARVPLAEWFSVHVPGVPMSDRR